MYFRCQEGHSLSHEPGALQPPLPHLLLACSFLAILLHSLPMIAIPFRTDASYSEECLGVGDTPYKDCAGVLNGLLKSAIAIGRTAMSRDSEATELTD